MGTTFHGNENENKIIYPNGEGGSKNDEIVRVAEWKFIEKQFLGTEEGNKREYNKLFHRIRRRLKANYKEH